MTNEPQYNEPQHVEYKGKRNSTGAKTAKAAIAAFIIGATVLASGFTYWKVVPSVEDQKETKRVVSLVESYTNEDGLCVIPSQVTINKSYDTRFAEGSKIASELETKGVKYCEILDQYYTAAGSDIAILTYVVTTTEVTDAEKVTINGAEIYMAPEGYVLDGKKCYCETTKTMTKIVPKIEDGNYTNIIVPNVSRYELIGVEEVSTLPYDSICDQTLICDVPDGAVLNEDNECIATLRLVPKEQ